MISKLVKVQKNIPVVMEKKNSSIKSFLQKWDFFVIMFFFYIIGISTYDQLPLLIPLRHQIVQEELLKIVIISFFAYMFGKKMNFNKKKFRNKIFIYDNLSIQILKIVFSIFAIISIGFYIINGFPIAQIGSGAAEAKLGVTGSRSYGITRILYIMMPFVSLYLFSIFINKSNIKKKKSISFYIIITLIILSLGLFKGQLVTYFLSLMILYDKFVKPIVFSFKSILISTLVILAITIPIFLTEINNYFDALLYIFNRLLIHSWEGFNYIVLMDLPTDILYQLESFLGLKYMESPDVLLGKEYTGRNDVDFAVVPTLFGFCYRNGGYLTIVLVFSLLGILVKSIIKQISYSNDSLLVVTFVMLYFQLFKILLVGNIFNALRGPVLTLFLIYFLMKFIKRKYKYA